MQCNVTVQIDVGADPVDYKFKSLWNCKLTESVLWTDKSSVFDIIKSVQF